MRRASPSHVRGLTQAQYARHRRARRLPGASREAVRKALAEGRIDLLPNRRIDPRAADTAWAERSVPKVGIMLDAPESLAANLRLISNRSDRESIRRQLDELRLGQATGMLVRADEIRDAATLAARTAHERLLAIADRLGAVLAACMDPAECRRMLRTEIEHACAALSKPLELLPEDPAARIIAVPALPPLPPQLPASYGRAGR